MRNIVCVAEATAAAVVLGRVDGARRDGLGFLPPILPESPGRELFVSLGGGGRRGGGGEG